MKKFKSNNGNSVFILGMSLIALVLLLGIFIVDVGKAMYVKNLYSSYARKAVQLGVKYQDSIGGLKPESAEAVIREYYTQKTANGRNNTNESVYSTHCSRLAGYPKIRIKYDNKRAKDASSAIYSSENYRAPYIADRNSFFRKQYNTIEVEIIDVTDNYFFSMFGVPCAKMNIKASGIATTSFDEDELNINKKP